jgi:hypothetical protein
LSPIAEGVLEQILLEVLEGKRKVVYGVQYIREGAGNCYKEMT